MLSKASEYAIRALVSVKMHNLEGKRPGFKAIAKDIDAPEQYLAKVMQSMTKHKILSSVRGRNGGFFFRNPDEEIKLIEPVKIFEGKRFFTKCGFGFSHCDANNPCPLHNEFEPVRDALIGILEKETVTSLAMKVKNGEATLSRLLANH